MDPEQTPPEQITGPIKRLRRLLIFFLRSSMKRALGAVLVLGVLVVLLALIVLSSIWLWGVVAHYVQPRTPSDRKDLVNVFVVIGAGGVGLLTATAAVGNLYISRRNLQQQRDLEAERAQDDALQAYYKQVGDLLTEHDLNKTKLDDDVALLARAQTLAVVRRVDAKRKSDLVLFLYGAGLVKQATLIVSLRGADLSGADLSRAKLSEVVLIGANLRGADLREADLSFAYLSNTDLSRANLRYAFLRYARLSGADLSLADLRDAYLGDADLRYADLSYARLSNADLSDADLSDADLSYARLSGADLSDAMGKTEEQLDQQAMFLKGATMPNGQRYEEWRKDREGGKEDEKYE